jgi:iron(III) transport system permease protein
MGLVQLIDRTASRFSKGKAILLSIAGVPLLAILVVLAVVLTISFEDSSHSSWTLKNFTTLYTSSFAYGALLNTAGFAVISVLVACFFAVPIAWAVERTDLPGKNLSYILMTLGIVIPPFFMAMGWLVLLHERMGIVNVWLRQVLPFSYSPFDIGGVWGMGWVSGLSLVPLAFIMIAASFRAMDPSLEEAAQIHGMNIFSRIRRIVGPLAWPSVLGAGLYIFVIGLSSFDIPAVMGLGSRTFTFSTFVYSLALPTNEPPDYGIVGASSALMLIIGLGVCFYYLRVIHRSHRFAVVTGRNYRPALVTLKKSQAAGWWSFITLLLGLQLVVPFLALVWISLTPFLQQPSQAALRFVSLNNFYKIPWDALLSSLKATAIITVTVPTITAGLALAVSWIVVRSGLKLASAVDTIAFLPHAVPSLIFAVGVLFIGLFWLPEPINPYGTVEILIIAFVIIRLSFATRMYNSALLQIHRELDEAGYIGGLGDLKVLWRILLPLLRPTILVSWLWMAVLASRELTVAVILTTSTKNVTTPVLIWGLWQNGKLNESAAIALVFLLMLTPLIVVFFWATNRRVSNAMS